MYHPPRFGSGLIGKPYEPYGPFQQFFDGLWNDMPTCPHCGVEDQDWSDGLSLYVRDGSEWEAKCSTCMQPYFVMMAIETSFKTRKKETP